MAGELSSHKVRGRDGADAARRIGRRRCCSCMAPTACRVWLPVFDLLSQHFEVIVPEHPGFGASDNPPWMRNIGDLAMYYLDFIDGCAIIRSIWSDSRSAAGRRPNWPCATARG